jgi:hypothetical protein
LVRKNGIVAENGNAEKENSVRERELITLFGITENSLEKYSENQFSCLVASTNEIEMSFFLP